MKLHIADKSYSSWSLRPWVLMTQLNIPFEEHMVPFGNDTAWQSYRQVASAGKVPALVEGATVVWDSLAITEYLAEQHPAVWPADATARAWARCAAAEMHSGFGQLRSQCPMNCVMQVERAALPETLQAELSRLQALWHDGLQRFGGPFLAADRFTAVDAFFCPVAFRVWGYGLPMDDTCSAYVQRLLALPAMRQWQQAALKEQPEPNHEADCLKAGRVLRDWRLTP